MMRQLMMKELTEHLRWAALAGAAFLAALGLVQGSMAEPMAVTDRQLVGDVALGGMAWGVLLGLLQNLRDGRSVWLGLLMHRPVTLARIARAKLASGLVLYAMAIFLPVALICLWLSRTAPNRPPFIISSVTPIVIASLVGLLGYLAASHVAIRQARWWVSRTLPVVFAFCGLFCLEGTYLLGVLLGLLGIGVALTSVLFGWFTAQGHDEQVRWWPRFCWSVAMLIPLGLLGTVLADAQVRMVREHEYSEYVLDTQGKLILLHLPIQASGKPTRYTDLEQHPLPAEPVLYPKLTLAIDPHPKPVSEDAHSWWRSALWTSGWINAGHYGWRVANDHEVNFFWYESTGQILACSEKTGDILGYVGTTGVGAGPTTPWGKLQSDFSGAALFVSAGAAYALNAEEGRLQLLLSPQPGEVITSINTVNHVSVELQYIISTSRRLVMLAQDGTQRLSCPLPSLPGAAAAEVVPLTSDPRTVVLFTPYRTTAHGPVPESPELVTYDANGHPSTPLMLPVIVNAAPTLSAAPAWLCVIRPPVTVFMVPSQPWHYVLAVVVVLAACTTLIIWSRRWQLETSSIICWSLAIVAVGPLALAPWLALRQGPPRERCPQCRRLRVITRSHCEHCQGPFAPPSVQVIDIIDAQPWTPPVLDQALEA